MNIRRRVANLERRAGDGGAVILASADLDGDGRRRVFCDVTSYRLTDEEMTARWPDALVLIGLDPDGGWAICST